MDELFATHSASSGPQRTVSSNFILRRTTTGLSRPESDDQGSDCSECGGQVFVQSVSGRIALAKRVLAEATHTFAAPLSVTAAKSDKCRNTGALGPLCDMIQSSSDIDTLRSCLDTLSFMLLDKANRLVVHELGGLQVILRLFTQHTDAALLRMALECVVCMVKADDREKVRVWQHPGKAGIYSLLHPRASAGQLLEVLCMVRKIAFRGAGPAGPHELFDPSLLSCVATLLASPQPHAVVLKCCKFLKYAGICASADQVPVWQHIVTLLVPMLRNPAVIDGVLGVLSSLNELYAFKNMFTAAGGVPVLLPLLAHPVRGVRLAASCVLSCLSEGGLSRELLCSKPCLDALLRVLYSGTQPVCQETAVAVVYCLHNTTRHSHAAAQHLMELGAVSRLTLMLDTCTDQELHMGLTQLLSALQAIPQRPPMPPALPPAAYGNARSRLSMASPMLHLPLNLSQDGVMASPVGSDQQSWRSMYSMTALPPEDTLRSCPRSPCGVVTAHSCSAMDVTVLGQAMDAGAAEASTSQGMDTSAHDNQAPSSGQTSSAVSVSLYASEGSRTSSPQPPVSGGHSGGITLTPSPAPHRPAQGAAASSRRSAESVRFTAPHMSSPTNLALVLGARLGLYASASAPCLLRACADSSAVVIGC